MDPWMIRTLCAVLAAVLLGVIVVRRRRTKPE
jgi:MYXO-CTERM domain-containing protein